MECHWCRRALIDPKVDKSGRRANLSATRDHIMPVSKGGRKTVWACRQCNCLKSDIEPHIWRLVINRHPRFWKVFRSHTDVVREGRAIMAEIAYHRVVRRWQKRCRFEVAPPPLSRGLPTQGHTG